MFAGLLGEVEDAPVFEAPDCAAAAEDEGAGCACNSIKGIRERTGREI